ncbi:putative membrane protein [Ehrlichia cf. muris str. EmCRT]|uniref:Putative membrane protein n=1 Tax=Ehrlichia cf. muris str. EmCRT TaxID=1359167 RepID=A0A0F3NCU1_9RICK|nr:putative membrane protein [Ehrlichia cf. muris str. EmCRT]
MIKSTGFVIPLVTALTNEYIGFIVAIILGTEYPIVGCNNNM